MVDPAAVCGEVSEGADGVEHFGAGEAVPVNILDDVAEGGLEIAVAECEKIEGVGVVVDGGFIFDAKAMHDCRGTAPVKKGFVYVLALRMAADGALAGVAFEEGGFGGSVFVFAT